MRFDVFPDGGISRLRLFGSVLDVGRRRLGINWPNALPKTQALVVLTSRYGLTAHVAERAIELRPWADATTVAALMAALPEAEALRSLLCGASTLTP